MKVIGIRFCSVNDEAEALSGFLGQQGLGLPQTDLGSGSGDQFPGAVFPAGTGSWIETWRAGPEMPAGVMLQIVVDNADAFAEQAKSNGLTANGPMDAHGERIYFFEAPGGLAISVQSKLEDQ